jgi:hypothetical protein
MSQKSKIVILMCNCLCQCHYIFNNYRKRKNLLPDLNFLTKRMKILQSFHHKGAIRKNR